MPNSDHSSKYKLLDEYDMDLFKGEKAEICKSTLEKMTASSKYSTIKNLMIVLNVLKLVDKPGYERYSGYKKYYEIIKESNTEIVKEHMEKDPTKCYEWDYYVECARKYYDKAVELNDEEKIARGTVGMIYTLAVPFRPNELVNLEFINKANNNFVDFKNKVFVIRNHKTEDYIGLKHVVINDELIDILKFIRGKGSKHAVPRTSMGLVTGKSATKKMISDWVKEIFGTCSQNLRTSYAIRYKEDDENMEFHSKQLGHNIRTHWRSYVKTNMGRTRPLGEE